MAGYDMKELAKDLDIAIRELRGIRKEMIVMRKALQRQHRLIPLVSADPEEDPEETEAEE